MFLGGDVGGTNARLGLFSQHAMRPELEITRTYPTRAFPNMEAMLRTFCRECGVEPSDLDGAGFGVAGPVLDNVVTLTNANWHIDGNATARALGLERVRIVNDLEAMAWGVTVLQPGEYITVHGGSRDPRGNVGIIAPGTGLGESLLHHVDGRLMPSPSEGGHADLGPRTPREIELLRFLTAQFGRASYEHVLSGPGLVNLFQFTHATPCGGVDLASPDAPAQVTARALTATCPSCAEALDLFVSLLGAEAGNLALRSVATGGVFIGGGIPPRILPALQDGRLVRAFLAKAPADDLVSRVPVHVIVYPDPGLIGAAVLAGRR
jgi:glucokinase